jgi:hypothetical protein
MKNCRQHCRNQLRSVHSTRGNRTRSGQIDLDYGVVEQLRRNIKNMPNVAPGP